ncbi:MAG: rod shape-determining protein MreC [Bacteroidota bacterium]
MQQIIYFFIRNKNFLLFLLLFLIAIGITINSHSYHKTQYTSSANTISGSLFSIKSSITSYFGLKKQNELLVEENTKLREQLANASSKNEPSEFSVGEKKYDVVLAEVINNSYSKSKNQLTLNKGKKDSVFIDMGVISQEGIVGIVSHTSNHYASVLSVLNTQSQIVTKFKKSNQSLFSEINMKLL